jgi:hypothetical protein
VARPKLYTSVEDMQKIIDEYFIICDEKEKPYTMSGLAYALDMDRKSLLNYSKDEQFFPTIKKAREKVEQQLEENALMGKANATFTIFNLKNNYGWRDQVEVKNENELSKLDELLGAIKNDSIK